RRLWPSITTVTAKFCISVSAGVDAASSCHKRLQRRRGLLASSNIPQRSRPFADRLAIGVIVTRAANDRTKWVCVLGEGKIGKFKGMSQKLLGPSPYFVMLDDCKHGF